MYLVVVADISRPTSCLAIPSHSIPFHPISSRLPQTIRHTPVSQIPVAASARSRDSSSIAPPRLALSPGRPGQPGQPGTGRWATESRYPARSLPTHWLGGSALESASTMPPLHFNLPSAFAFAFPLPLPPGHSVLRNPDPHPSAYHW